LLLLAAPALTPLGSDPPIRVWFNFDGNYSYADRAKVYAKTTEDAYLIVLRADAAGRVRVLFPLDPTDDQRIARGKKYELKGRGGREAFVVNDSSGHGTVIAAISSTPFRVDQFARQGHWDTRVLSDQTMRDDAEAGLRALVRRMTPRGEPVVYSVANYVVSEKYARARYPSRYAGAGWWSYDPFWGFRPGFWYRRTIVVVR
jgi:hypothetical protein